MSRASLVVLVCGLVVGFAWHALSAWTPLPLAPVELARVFGAEHGALRWVLAIFAGAVLPLPLHELVHAAMFRSLAPRGARIGFGANWEMGMIYACAEGVVYSRRAYVAIALAPTFAVTTAIAVFAAFLRWPLWGIACAFIHLAGCTGDWGYVRAICRDPRITRCEDTAWGVQFYGEGAASGKGES